MQKNSQHSPRLQLPPAPPTPQLQQLSGHPAASSSFSQIPRSPSAVLSSQQIPRSIVHHTPTQQQNSFQQQQNSLNISRLIGQPQTRPNLQQLRGQSQLHQQLLQQRIQQNQNIIQRQTSTGPITGQQQLLQQQLVQGQRQLLQNQLNSGQMLQQQGASGLQTSVQQQIVNQHMGQLNPQQITQLQQQQLQLKQNQMQQQQAQHGQSQQQIQLNQNQLLQNQGLQQQSPLNQQQQHQINQQQNQLNQQQQNQQNAQPQIQMSQSQGFVQQNINQHVVSQQNQQILQQKQQFLNQQAVTSQQQIIHSQSNLAVQQQQGVSQGFNQSQTMSQEMNQQSPQQQQQSMNQNINQLSAQALNQQLNSQNLGPQLNQQQLNQQNQLSHQLNQQNMLNQQLNQQNSLGQQLNQHDQLNQQNQLNQMNQQNQLSQQTISQQTLEQNINQTLNQQLNQGLSQQMQQQQLNRQNLQQQQLGSQQNLNQQIQVQQQPGLGQQNLQQQQQQQITQINQQINPGLPQQVVRTQFQQQGPQIGQQILINQQQSPQNPPPQRAQINQHLWAQQPAQVPGQQIIRHPVNVVQQAGPRVQWSANPQQGNVMPQRQFIQLDARTHNELQKMPPEQQALFVAKLQRQRQLWKQVQQRGVGGSHILIRAAGKTTGHCSSAQHSAAKHNPRDTDAARHRPKYPARPGLSPINQNNAQFTDQNQQQQLQLRQYRLQQLQLQREQAQKNHLAQQQQGPLTPQPAIVRPIGQPQLADSTTNPPQVQDGNIQHPLVVNAKTKTALANMLSIKLQSGGSSIGVQRPEAIPEPSAAGTLRLMTAQHNAALNSKPQEIIALQRRPQLPLTPTNEPPKLQYCPKPALPLQHRPGPFYGHNPNLKLPPDLFLLGCIFVVVEIENFLEEKISGWQLKIEKHGGEVEKQYCSRVTHVLCETQRHGVVMQALRDCKRCVTILWLSDVMQRKQVLPPWTALHLPSIYLDTAPASKHLISITGFEGNDRNRVKQMIKNTGAKCTTYFSKHNTLLISVKAEGRKCNYAKKWQIPVVNVQWLTDVMLGNFTAMNQMEHQIYQQYHNPRISASIPN
ncbi:hypothetical protein NQ318_016527 [Aromia moschata]|uniref:PAX-interacting protein 1 n=1 Tax=Aromia moschata TaxID=1265417 RepID=A0AAV8YX04_9CUCU|nr:hypothetical protein NQ318_016527 [Aromia moschata]